MTDHSEIPYRQCLSCQYIEDCPNKDFNELTKMDIPPKECHRRSEIKLTPRVKDIMPPEYFEDDRQKETDRTTG